MTDDDELAAMRVEYGGLPDPASDRYADPDGSGALDPAASDPGALDPAALAGGWAALLRRWLAEAGAGGVTEPNAMVLATVDPEGRPASRTVLCKGVDDGGITFYSNYDSAKADDLSATPYASATFPWYALQRQVHVRGVVRPVDADVTARYWASRPRGSQLGAWASAQSRPIDSRAALTAALDAVTERFAGQETVPVPPRWGGYRIAADTVEFWQGRRNRLHDRIRVSADGTVVRLQP